MRPCPTDPFIRLIGRCELFSAAARSACYRWLGRTITVVTDGAFRALRLS